MNLLHTPFTAYEFSTREELEASILSPLQHAYISTLRASVANQLLNLTGVLSKDTQFAEQHLHLKGQLDILTQILETHTHNSQELAQLQE